MCSICIMGLCLVGCGGVSNAAVAFAGPQDISAHGLKLVIGDKWEQYIDKSNTIGYNYQGTDKMAVAGLVSSFESPMVSVEYENSIAGTLYDGILEGIGNDFKTVKQETAYVVPHDYYHFYQAEGSVGGQASTVIVGIKVIEGKAIIVSYIFPTVYGEECVNLARGYLDRSISIN